MNNTAYFNANGPKYKIIYYSPRPELGERLAVGAKHLDPLDGNVTIIRGTFPNTPNPVHTAMVETLLERAEASPEMSVNAFGPHFLEEEWKVLPAGFTLESVTKMVNP